MLRIATITIPLDDAMSISDLMWSIVSEADDNPRMRDLVDIVERLDERVSRRIVSNKSKLYETADRTGTARSAEE